MADNFDPPRNQRKQLQHRRKSSQSQPRSTQSLGSAVKASATQTLSIPESVNTAVIQDDYSHEQMEYTWEMRGGEEMSGVSECAITDETNSSWLVIGEARHQRSYSNESNRISDAVSDGPCLSTPSDGRPEWTYAPPYTAVREDNYFPDLGHNDPLLLSDLSDPGARYYTWI
jgi:hypothetical protein